MSDLKILQIEDLYFKLPDDFSGGLSQALRALANYHDEVMNTPRQVIGSPSDERDKIPLREAHNQLFDQFWDMIHTDSDHRVKGSLSMTKHDSKTNKMIHLDLNTGEPEE